MAGDAAHCDEALRGDACAGEAPAVGRVEKRKHEHSVDVKAIRRSGGVYVKRRADGRYLTHLVLPRIVKSDIRRHFPQIFCNLDNTNDPTLMRSFLDTFSVPTAFFDHVCHDVLLNGERYVNRLTATGAEQVTKFWASVGDVLPDRISRVLDAQVRARSDGTGVVECTLQLLGTVVVRPDLPPVGQRVGRDVALMMGLTSLLQRSEAMEQARAESAGGQVQRLVMGSPMVVSLRTTATLVFELDCSNRIERARFEKAAPSIEFAAS